MRSVLFSGVVVLILDEEKQVEGVGRLFERVSSADAAAVVAR